MNLRDLFTVAIASFPLASLACAPSAKQSFIREPDRAALGAVSPKDRCVVAAEIRASFGAEMSVAKLAVSSGKLLETPGFTGSATHGGGFAFTDVPLGEFRVTNIDYAGKPAITFNNLGLASSATKTGDLPNEMSGTCNGGFIWLGSFKASPPGTFSAPSMELGSNSVTAGYAKADMKASVAGTPWEAEIDRPAANTPLPKGKNPEGKVDPEAGAKATAAIAGQTRQVSAPPSDPGAHEAAAGTWTLESINGKPLPYLFPANKCTMLQAGTELKGDGSYSADLSMECGGKKIPFPTSGLYGVVGGNLTFAVAVGPVATGVVAKITADTLTITAGPDAYLYKKK
jgi:hypothetical protein